MNKPSNLILFALVFVFINSLHGAEISVYEQYVIPPSQRSLLEPKGKTLAEKYADILWGTDIVLLFDVSGSMLFPDQYPFPGAAPKSQYQNPMAPGDYWKRGDSSYMIGEYLTGTALQYDKDHKVPVYFFGTQVTEISTTHPQQLFEQFAATPPAAGQGTNLLGALTLAFNNHIIHPKTDRILFIVITDGEPNDKKEKFEKLIYKHLTKNDKKGDRLNIFFIQIGDDEGATEFLKYLDNGKRIKKNVDSKKDNWVYAQPGEMIILKPTLENKIKSH
jgi:hypothetical protein